jgi:hypothetical protein
VSWQPSSDLDIGDIIQYRIEWSQDSSFATTYSALSLDTVFTIDGMIENIYMPAMEKKAQDPARNGYSVLGADDPVENPGEGEALYDDQFVYWRIYALDTHGLETICSAGYNGWKFLLDIYQAPLAFSLISPVDETVLSDTSMEISWLSTVDPDPYDTLQYEVWLDTLEDFSTTWMVGDNTTDTMIVLNEASGLLNFHTFYWRVKATDSNTEGTWSSETFSLIVPFVFGRDNRWSGIPTSFGITDIFPNPFNGYASILVGLPEATDLKVNIYDVLGRKVSTLVYGPYSEGYHKIKFDAGNLASGVYFVRAVAGNKDALKRIVILK